ncbi:MAG: nonstructural protein [Microviridae sp.]|nr:MAG: nonstructural protein [Microviridae sp.]
MQKSMFSCFDSKAGVFSSPFTSINSNVALRDFSMAASDPNSQISQYPEDYILYEIATFDDSTGVITEIAPPINLGHASQFKILQEG